MADVIGKEHFDRDVIASDKLVVVDFFATWCMPCKMIAHSIEEISNEMKDKVKVYKVDVDNSSDLAVSYNVRSVPTVLFFKNGQIADKIIGAVPKDAILTKIEGLL